MNKQVNIEQILPLVRKPGRYIGGELNAADKAWEKEQVHFCLIFPDLYEIGMSHQGLQILYHILNQREDALAHRCFTPDVDMEAALKASDQPLFSLEQRRPLADYDILGITLPYELCFTNILTVLDLALIPLHAKDRNEQHPIVLGGGAAAFNPEPVADFFDAIVLGDGEEIIEELTEQFVHFKQQGYSREEILKQLSSLTGVYVPAYFTPQYNGSQIACVEPVFPEYTSVMRRVLPEMQSPTLLTNPLVPIVKPVHDRLGIEIARGCTRGCRFCQAGITYRPVRERSLDDIMELAEAGIANSGFDELALLSLSTGDYSCLGPLMTKLMDRFADEYVSVSMPSMRVGTLTPQIMDQIKRVRKTGFTVAPEAGTDRLREVINKGISEQDLMDTCHDAFALGWNLIKFYFMIGLPTETDEDVDAIVELARKAKLEAGEGRGGKVKINVSIGTFVPKPHTPFQWEPQISREQSRAKINHLKQILPRKGFALKWHEPEQSYLEGVFSRGDRRLAALILKAWQNGARLDGWSEHFNLHRWQVAAEECGIEMDTYLRERTTEEILPWDHLHCGVDRQFLEQELADAKKQLYTEDCRNQGCQKCGLCDFKTVKPRVNEENEVSLSSHPVHREKVVKPERRIFVYKVAYSRMGDSRFYGHLEILQLIFRALHRAGLPVLFSQGYNPSPKVSFSQALPVGIESRAEYFYVELAEPLPSLAQTISDLDAQLPTTITVTDITLEKKVRQASYCAMYKVTMDEFSVDEIQQKVSAFVDLDQLIIERIRKRKRRQLDLRPLVASMETQGHDLFVELFHYHGQAGTNPREILEHGLHLSPEQALLTRIQKVEIREIETPV